MTVGFPEVPIGELARPVERPERPIAGRSYRQLGVRLWGEGAYEREAIDGGETRYARLSRVAAGDIVVNKIWARNGSVAVVPPHLEDCYVSGEFPTFQCQSDRLDPQWFHWITRARWFWERCDTEARGTSGKNRIRPERFLTIPIPSPSALEQRRIVAQIEKLAAKIEEARGLRLDARGKTSRLPQSCSALFFSTEGRSDVEALESLCSAIIDCPHSNPIYSDGGVPTLRSPDVGWGSLDLAGAKKTSEAGYSARTQRGEPRVNDIVVVREGGGTGKAGIVLNGQRFSLGQRVTLLRPRGDRVLPRFLLHQWLSAPIQESQILPLTKGSASPHLNISAIRRFPFVVPPIPEQRRIVAHLDGLQAKVDALKFLQEKTAAELDALLPSILDKAFRGEL